MLAGLLPERFGGARPLVMAMHCIGENHVDLDQGAILREDKLVSLTPMELELLRYLFEHSNRTVTRKELMHNVWGRTFPSARTIDMHVASLRRKLEANSRQPEYILTVRGVGYEFRSGGRCCCDHGTNR
jgi:DNA-binding response OmpR family regulator